MKAGLLKDKIIILEPSIVTSEFGENSTKWLAKYTTKARVKYQSQNRSTENNEIVYTNTVEFTVRYYVPVTEWDRVLYEGKNYRILSLLPNKDDQSIKLVTEEVNE